MNFGYEPLFASATNSSAFRLGNSQKEKLGHRKKHLGGRCASRPPSCRQVRNLEVSEGGADGGNVDMGPGLRQGDARR